MNRAQQILAFVVMAFLTSACTDFKEPDVSSDISLSPTEIVFPYKGGTAQVEVSAPPMWTVGKLPEWLSINKIDDTDGVRWTIEFKADENPGRDRDWLITIARLENQKTLTVSQKGVFSSDGKENSHLWVDLGLPSGIKWATCNVGAMDPEEYGDYFAWGECEAKTDYSWSTLKYCLDAQGRSFSKYVTDSGYGEVDNKIVLELADDAAQTNWGGSWRIPSKEEFEELVNNCSWTWTTLNKVAGYRVTSRQNDNSIFLPAAGGRNKEATTENSGIIGCYWLPYLDPESPDKAGGFCFSKSSRAFKNDYRHLGFVVRPVTDKDVRVPVIDLTLNKQTQPLTEGGKFNLTATITPDNATQKAVIWSSSNSEIAVVRYDGEVTAVTEGSVIISATAYDGNGEKAGKVKASCEVTVSPFQYSLDLNEHDKKLNDGETLQLEATINPPEAGKKDLVWTSDDEVVASVSETGLVTAKFPGEATVTVSTADGKKSDTCKITVELVRPNPVDMGLPSDLKWASFPLGAPGPREAGDRFAWGETRPDTYYDWEHYDFWMEGSTSSDLKFMKYVGNVGYGTVDNLTVLQAEDDAATKLLGSGWRIPELVELKELTDSDNCQVEYNNGLVSITGKKGQLYINNNIVWSSNLYSAYSYQAYWFYLSSASVYAINRCSGYALLPVYGKRPVHINSIKVDERITLKVGESKTINVTFDPASPTYTKLKYSSSNEAVAKVSRSGEVTAVGEGPATITVESVYESGIKTTCLVSVPITTIKTPEYEDLGLPSEVMWATFDVGADAANKEGLKYAWGETEPKEKYEWSNYIWGNSGAIKKYNDTDGIKTLLPADDVATVKLGNNWRMPTKREIDELLNTANCEWKWDIQNNVYGYNVVSNVNGNSIFFPVPSSTKYWSATRSSTTYSYAINLSSTPPQSSTSGRAYEARVRPVYDAPRESTLKPVDLGLSVQWASCNLGAIGENGYGDYYDWAGTNPRDKYKKEGSSYYNGSEYTKYVNSGTYADKKKKLDKGDDAAYAKLGGNWRIPTEAEWEELKEKCEWEWRSNGYIIKGQNGNSIFLPATDGLESSNNGQKGSYRCSTNYKFSDIYVSSFGFSKELDSRKFTGCARYLGFPVRPVTISNVESVSIEPEIATIEEDEQIVLTAKIQPESATDKSVKWESLSPEIATVDENNGTVTPVFGKRGKATIKVTTNDGGKSATCVVTVVQASSFKGVDLGLPSGIKWANMNLGATAIEGNGKYYAWGATATKIPFTEENAPYYEKTYPYNNLLSELALSDDAANFRLEGKWRIPKKKDFEELKDKCTVKAYSINNVEGVLITSRLNGRCIFLPAAGCYYRADKHTGLVYWTATTSNLYATHAYIIGSASYPYKSINLYLEPKYLGLPIRPVQDK